MIKEYCDKCFAQVGNKYDGGKDIPKRNAIEVLAFIGCKGDYILCPQCYNEFCNTIRMVVRL